jgi:hypothetical protein
MPTIPKVTKSVAPTVVTSGNMLSLLPPEFVRQLNPAGRRLLEHTPYRRIPGNTSYAGWGRVLIGGSAPTSTIVHEAMHILSGGLGRSMSSPENLRGTIPATEFYTASTWQRNIGHTIRLALFPSMRREEVLAAAVQRTNITGQPLSGIGTYGFTNQMRQPLLRYFSPTALGLGAGIRSTREVRMMTGLWR